MIGSYIFRLLELLEKRLKSFVFGDRKRRHPVDANPKRKKETSFKNIRIRADRATVPLLIRGGGEGEITLQCLLQGPRSHWARRG